MQVLKSENLQSGDVMSCIHNGDKTLIKIKYNGNPKTLQACPDCENIINSSKICEVIV